jgi:hypothetical protein
MKTFLLNSIKKDFSSMSNLKNYSEVLLEIKKVGNIKFKTMSEISYLDKNSQNKILGIRHDIDSDLETALKLARIEHRQGISSTYYVLHTAQYYWSDYLQKRSTRCLRILREIQELGHEIGLHNDALGVLLETGVSPIETLKKELDFLRGSSLSVTGTASHGSFHQYNASNYEVFTGLSIDNRMEFTDVAGIKHPLNYIDPKELDLNYEANYILDSKLISSKEYSEKYCGRFVSKTDYIDWMTRDYDFQWGVFGKDFWIETNEKTGEVNLLSQKETIKRIVTSREFEVGVLDSHPEYFGNRKNRRILNFFYRMLKGVFR